MQVLVNKNNVHTNLKITIPLLFPGSASHVLLRLLHLSSAGRPGGHRLKPAVSLWGFLLLTSFPCSSVGSPGRQLPWEWPSAWAEVGALSGARYNLLFFLLLLFFWPLLFCFWPFLFSVSVWHCQPLLTCSCHSGSFGVAWNQLCWAWSSSSQSSQRPLLGTCVQYKSKGNISIKP